MNMRQTLKLASRSWLITVIMAFVALMFFPALSVSNIALRMVINCAVLFGSGLFAYSLGVNVGDEELSFGDLLDRRIANNGYTPTALEDSLRYNRARGVLALIIGALPWVLIAVVVLVTGAGFDHTAVATAPQYLFPDRSTMQVSTHQYVDMVARVCFAAFVGFFEVIDNYSYDLLDKLFLPMAFIYPLAVFIGYMLAPVQHRKKLKMIEEGKKNKLRKIRAAQRRKQRAAREQKPEV